MKKLVTTQILIFILLSVNAQEQLPKARNLTLKFPFSSLVGDIYGESMGIGFGIEKKLKTNISYSQEIGYIFHVNTNSILSSDLTNINGIKLTSEMRRYFNRNDITQSGFFANLELKNILTRSEQETLKITRYRGVLTTNVGVLFYWDQYKKSKITLELLAGGGFGYINAHSNVNTQLLRSKSDYNSAKGFYPMVNFDIKLGYILK